MILINLKNIEKLILLDQDIKNLLPDLRHIFDQWLLSYRIPALGHLRKKSILDLLNSLSDKHLLVLKKHFGDSVNIERIDHNIVKNFKFDVDEKIVDKIFEVGSFEDFTISSDGDKIHITFWK